MVAGPGANAKPAELSRYSKIQSMTIPEHLLDILCCPVSHEPLLPLSRDKLKQLNQAIAAGTVQYVDHEPVAEPLKAALITRDKKVVYAIADGIPVLLPERGIGTTQLSEPL
jgi:uncharacterized protein